MFLSVIVPVYNAREHLAECLSSLLNQDIPREMYEILCVDDGSTDDSPQILDTFSAQNPNLTVIRQENGGVAAARNRGLEAAGGAYVWFVDADDLVKENCLGALQAKAEQTDCDRLVFGAYQFQDVLSETERRQAEQGELPENAPWYDAVVWRCLLKREFLNRHKLYFRYPELSHGEDGLFMYEVCESGPRDAQLPDVLYFYRVHAGSAETNRETVHRMKKIRSCLRIAEILRDYRDQGREDSGTANLMMTFLWMGLYETAGLPDRDRRTILEDAGKRGLYPFQRPEECTMERSFMTGREDWIGRCFDCCYLHLHRPWGFAAMRFLQGIIRSVRTVRR